VSFVAGAIPPHDGDTSAELSLTPLDASKLAPLPNNMRFEANAYHVDVRYQPRATLASLPNPRRCPDGVGPATDVLYSADGKSWKLLPTPPSVARQASPRRSTQLAMCHGGFGHPYSWAATGPRSFSYAGLAVLVLARWHCRLIAAGPSRPKPPAKKRRR